jgi:hypothetical protein
MDKSPRTKKQKQKQNAKGDITIRTRFKGGVEVVWKTKQEKELRRMNVNDKETATCILLAYEAGRLTQVHGSNQERCHSHGVLPQEQHA